ncbi:ribosomal protein L1p/L10e family protein [Colletotrichum orchidophilum]|uniref:Ribosomal protein L1p/L10e family protein n=1 Tax=Colletotrichum orchidophilum TaxID=1209926 RepID=A0A1G4BKR0_9PEZI|nr:ribosomal protein L1p/L10e family protein [Colletotrichum orchidophilum]OHF01888.1 ribosomal protein L1p/L10e family protein [Colletotrichum orchidophilum]
MARLSLGASARPTASNIPRFLVPSVAQQTRCASNQGGNKKTDKKKKKLSKDFKTYNVKNCPQFSLCDAMRYVSYMQEKTTPSPANQDLSYLRAFEVGRPPQSIKYEIHVHLKTPRNGAVVKNRIRLPNPVKSDIRVGVICPEGSPIAQQALQAGAVVAGQESVFEAIKNDNIIFNRLICHTDSEAALNKAALGRILGPKGLMPNRRMKTITDNIASSIRETMGADNYRERTGVIRMAIGQLGFTPKMLSANIKAFVGSIKSDLAELETHKEVHEVVLSSSQAPGFSLNGNFDSTDEQVVPAHLSNVM